MSNSSHFLLRRNSFLHSVFFASLLSLGITDLQSTKHHTLFSQLYVIFFFIPCECSQNEVWACEHPTIGFLLYRKRTAKVVSSVFEKGLRLKVFVRQNVYVDIFATCLSPLSPITSIKHDELNNCRHFIPKWLITGRKLAVIRLSCIRKSASWKTGQKVFFRVYRWKASGKGERWMIG